MDARLMDKEVLCIYDIRAIQAYIFSNNNNIDILGAGEFVKDIHQESFEYALSHCPSGLTENEYCLREWENPTDIPYFYDENVKAQLVTIGGGNAFMLFRSGALAQEVNKIYSRYLLEKSYSLQVAIAATERTDNFAQDINSLYNELVRIKNTQPFFHPLGTLPIVEKEAYTGNPVHAVDGETGEHISLETLRKRERARKGIGEDVRLSMANIGQYHNTLAYIHIDGNGFGMAIGKIFQSITDYEEGVIARRKLNSNIMLQYLASLDESEELLRDFLVGHGIPAEHFPRYYQRINIGGDDINVVCAAQYAFRFVKIFVDVVTKKYLWNDERVGAIKFSVCAGIAFVSSDIEYSQGYQLAEQCCAEAKKEAKKPENAINGEVGNWVDYQSVQDRRLEDVSTQRERDYQIGDYSLCLRPYCLDPERAGTPTHIGHLLELFTALRSYLPASIRWHMLDAISENPSKAGLTLNRIVLDMREEEREAMEQHLFSILGDDLLQIEGRPNPCAHWYDALELASLIDMDRLHTTTVYEMGREDA